MSLNIIFSNYNFAKAISEVSLESYRKVIFLNRCLGLESISLESRLNTKRKYLVPYSGEKNKIVCEMVVTPPGLRSVFHPKTGCFAYNIPNYPCSVYKFGIDLNEIGGENKSKTIISAIIKPGTTTNQIFEDITFMFDGKKYSRETKISTFDKKCNHHIIFVNGCSSYFKINNRSAFEPDVQPRIVKTSFSRELIEFETDPRNVTKLETDFCGKTYSSIYENGKLISIYFDNKDIMLYDGPFRMDTLIFDSLGNLESWIGYDGKKKDLTSISEEDILNLISPYKPKPKIEEKKRVCGAKTTRGTSCKRELKEGSSRCWQHSNKV